MQFTYNNLNAVFRFSCEIWSKITINITLMCMFQIKATLLELSVQLTQRVSYDHGQPQNYQCMCIVLIIMKDNFSANTVDGDSFNFSFRYIKRNCIEEEYQLVTKEEKSAARN